ncbi:DUF1642 domain-containing protein [Lactiplantibacillus plantarum]|uniref:DUF1642 domain-containing protein n=1 Tax=Lactiplantibacillus plantarum TaxID=1590 RepID=UPI003AFA7D2C
MPDSLLDALTGEPAYYSILIDDVNPEPDDFPNDNEVSFEIGDWIVNEADEIKVMADEEFKQQYVELPVIPKAVADWIGKCKRDGVSVGYMLCYERQPEKVRDWIELTNGNYEFNQKRYTEYQEVVARAWLDGYAVEEDK